MLSDSEPLAFRTETASLRGITGGTDTAAWLIALTASASQPSPEGGQKLAGIV
jgi:hypothetical protein